MFKKPENCGYFVPKVDGKMWTCMDHTAKSKDLKDLKRQTVIATTVNVIVLLDQKCMTGKTANNADLFNSLADAGGLMLKVLHDTVMDRRKKILSGPNMDWKYKKLASVEITMKNFHVW